jgi:phosphoribosylglycinamide formyltransferase-1
MKDIFKLVVLISGRGSNMEALAKTIKVEQLPIQIALVLSDQAQAKGLEIAKNYNLPTALLERRPKEISAEEYANLLVQKVREAEPDLIVLAGFMRILHPIFIQAFEGKIINIHPSLLPDFKGLHAQRQALEAGVKEAGCTVHLVTEELDAGEILGQTTVPVFTDDTEESLSARILVEEHKLLPKVVKELAGMFL